MRPAITALVTALIAAGAAAAARAEPPRIAASAAILMDAETGQVLYEKNADQRRPIASTTKIMTALIILEHGKPDMMCTASKHAAQTPQSSIWLQPGEHLRLGDLLAAILVKSANDACVAAAEAVAGSEAAFVELMNRRAQALGATNTHFVNPNGLYDPQHYSSARDLALISQVALRVPRFAELVRTKSAAIPWAGKDYERALVNKNKLLSMMPGADGIKTGYVRESGQCLVASATRDRWQLIAVLLDSPDLWEEAPALLEYGFHNFRALCFARRGEPALTVPVRGGARAQLRLVPSATLMLVLPRWSNRGYTPRVELTRSRIAAPVSAGEKMGRMVLTAGNRELTAVDLVAAEAVPRSVLASVRLGTTWFVFSLLAAAMVVRSYSVTTRKYKYRTGRVRVKMAPVQQAPRSSASPR